MLKGGTVGTGSPSRPEISFAATLSALLSEDQVFPENVSTFIAALTCWVSSQSDIESVALVGSYAREAAKEDSDVDIVILTADPDKYLLNKSWVSRFGESERYQEEDYGKLTSVRVFYASGLEVEFGFVTPDWARAPIDAGTKRVVSGGIKVLHDPHGNIARMLGEIDSTRTQGR
jgi:Nucleotidyltransferase domain.